MKLLTIRQLPRNLSRDMDDIDEISDRLEFAKSCLKNNQYIRVADITLPDEIEYPLEDAYKLTNSIHGPWYLNLDEVDGIEVAEYAQDGCRSTSMGDIIQLKGVSYLVTFNGFEEIK